MKYRLSLVAGSLILATFVSTALAQRLPEGEYHRIREREVDILHYRAELNLDLPNRKLAGRATIELAPLFTLSAFSLDAIQLNVKSVIAADSGESLAFDNDGRRLRIELPTPALLGERLLVVVEYQAEPKGGLYIQPDPRDQNLYMAYTYGEGGLHANWLPIYNDVNDKFTTEMIVTVPSPYVVISNGSFQGTHQIAQGLVAHHWLQDKPHSNYLISIHVGDFERGELGPALGSIPLSYWVPRGRLEEGAYAFRNTTKMVEYFSKLFDYAYPWVKYDQVAVPDFAIGAMEHTSVTAHGANVLRTEAAPLEADPTFEEYTSDWTAESLISHELGHHWFGNLLTCSNLSYIWLNESFASYLMMLWDEKALGRDQLLFDVQLATKHYLEYVEAEHIIRPLEYHYFDEPNAIYNEEHTYLKGASVLHMLRAVLGDDSFFRALAYFLDKHEFQNVVSDDLLVAIREATGQNLDWFFDDWVTGAGHPIFDVGYDYHRNDKLIDFTVTQIQPVVKGQDLFTLPVRVRITTPSKTWEEKLQISKESERFPIVSEEEPLLVSFDGEGDLVADIRFDKQIEELIYQAEHDAVPGRLSAIRGLASSYPTDRRALEALTELMSDGEAFWGIRAEAAYQLGTLRTSAAERQTEVALASADYRVRKAAVLALGEFRTDSSRQRLKRIVLEDTQTDVAATALLSLAQSDRGLDPRFVERQLSRPAWGDEMRLAAMQAFQALRNPDALPIIKEHVTPQYNQSVRSAALGAWEATEPEDPALHRTLIELTRGPVYTLQLYAIGGLGRLGVSGAARLLETVIEQNADESLVVAARAALAEITSRERRKVESPGS